MESVVREEGSLRWEGFVKKVGFKLEVIGGGSYR